MHNMQPFFDRLSRHKRIVRFVVVAVFVTIVVCFVFPMFEAMLNFGDSDLPPYQPDTPFEKICNGAWLIAALPVFAFGSILHTFGMDPNPPQVVLAFVFITPGLFWASLLEILLMLRGRFRPNKRTGGDGGLAAQLPVEIARPNAPHHDR
jgi:hypothetical protein